MADLPLMLVALGALFLAGLAADEAGRKSTLPRVTLLLGCGIIVGAPGLDLIPEAVGAWYEFLSVSALTMVAFLLGGSLSIGALKAHGREILVISGTIVAVTWAMVAAGLWALGVDPALALILGALATATDPAATTDVIRQSGRKSGFTMTMKGIVAIDDAWGLIVFSLALLIAHQMAGNANGAVLPELAREIGGSLLLGLAIGVPAAYLTGRVAKGEPLQMEALGLVFLTAGLSIWLHLSYLLAAMTAGAVIVNFARHHKRAFHEIGHIQWPFMMLFFILAGASLDIGALFALGAAGIGFLLLRTVSRLVGGWLGASAARSPAHQRRWFGVALLPQAGVAVGMALVAGEEFPDWGPGILALTIGTTVVFEILGPVATQYAIRMADSGDKQDKQV